MGASERRESSRLWWLPLLGLINATSPLCLDSEAAQDALGNVAEWSSGLLFPAFFVVLA